MSASSTFCHTSTACSVLLRSVQAKIQLLSLWIWCLMCVLFWKWSKEIFESSFKPLLNMVCIYFLNMSNKRNCVSLQSEQGLSLCPHRSTSLFAVGVCVWGCIVPICQISLLCCCHVFMSTSISHNRRIWGLKEWNVIKYASYFIF